MATPSSFAIVVGTNNPMKVAAARTAFERAFPGVTIDVRKVAAESGVGDQPMTDEATRTGALNRAEDAMRQVPEAHFCVGMEGGVEDDGKDMAAFAWIVVRTRDGRVGKGKTGMFFLPPEVARLVREGNELGVADDIVFARENSKQQNGAIGILTCDILTRDRFYADATVMALIPFLHEALYPSAV